MKTRQKKVMIFIPTLTAGGAERVCSILVNEWVEYDDLEVHLVLLFDDEIFYSVDKRVVVHRLGLKVNDQFIKSLIPRVSAMSRLRKLVKDIKPEFIFSFMHKYNIYCITTLLRLKKTKVIVSERDSPTERIHIAWSLLRKCLYRYSDGVVVQSRLSEEFIYAETKHKKIKAIPNPLKLSASGYKRKPDKILLSVGRLVPKKNHHALLNIFSKLKNDNWRLVICGDGPLKEELCNHAQRLNIENRVSFKGTIKDIHKEYSRAGIFVFTSKYEGFPNALAEALIAGIPSISFDCPTGPSEMIEDGVNGYLIDLDNEGAFVEKLNYLTGSNLTRLKMEGNAEIAREKFDSRKVALEYYKFCISC